MNWLLRIYNSLFKKAKTKTTNRPDTYIAPANVGAESHTSEEYHSETPVSDTASSIVILGMAREIDSALSEIHSGSDHHSHSSHGNDSGTGFEDGFGGGEFSGGGAGASWGDNDSNS